MGKGRGTERWEMDREWRGGGDSRATTWPGERDKLNRCVIDGKCT